MIKLVKGNILEAQTDFVVNTVNTVGVMGKGIALQFRNRYPLNNKLYEKAAGNNELEIGKMFVSETGELNKPHYIINFPTKKHWRNPSKLEYISKGLIDLKRVINELKIKSIAIPPLGCGNGGLDWNEVRTIIFDYLKDLNEIEILLFEPSDKAYLNVGTKKGKSPLLTNVRAMVLKLFQNYLYVGYDLSQLEAQKLVYFLQRMGERLNLEYTKNFYGPFAYKLTHVLQDMDGYYIEGMKFKEAKPNDPLKIKEEKLADVDFYINTMCSPSQKKRLSKVSQLIEGFESPFGMELLSTVDFVISSKKELLNNKENVIKEVRQWSNRKQKLMKPEYIESAYERLIEHADELY